MEWFDVDPSEAENGYKADGPLTGHSVSAFTFLMALDGHEDPSAGAPAYTTTTGQGLGDHTSSGVRPMNENENLPSLDKTADSTEGLDTLAASDSCGYDKKLDGLEGQDDGPPMAQLGFSEPAVVGSDAASPPVFLSGMKLALVFA